ncbi:MAG: hypothetical protein ACI92S_000227, partial [Planctomycetaceae bacterium]
DHGRHEITRKAERLFRVIPCLPWFFSFKGE